MSETIVIDRGREPYDWPAGRNDTYEYWTLLVARGGGRNRGVRVTAAKHIPYDGSLTYSTEDRPNRPDKRSEYQLDAQTVVRRYVDRSETDREAESLIDDVQVALAQLRGETEAATEVDAGP